MSKTRRNKVRDAVYVRVWFAVNVHHVVDVCTSHVGLAKSTHGPMHMQKNENVLKK
jgi:hypothetical protein